MWGWLWRDDVHHVSLCSPSTSIREQGSGSAHHLPLWAQLTASYTAQSSHTWGAQQCVRVWVKRTEQPVTQMYSISALTSLLQAASADLKLCEVINVFHCPRTTSCCLFIYLFLRIYMLCTLYHIQVTMKIFSPAFLSAVGSARTKQHLTSYKRSRESKKVSTKSAGSSPDWLSASALQSQSVTHPLPLPLLHYEDWRPGTARCIHLQAATQNKTPGAV